MKFLNLGTTVINLDKVVSFDVSRIVKATDTYHEYDDYGHRIDLNKKVVKIIMEGDRALSSTKPDIVEMFEEIAANATPEYSVN